MSGFFAWLKAVQWKQTITGLKVLLAAVGPSLIALAPTLGYQPTEIEKAIATATTILGLVLTVMERTSAAIVTDAKDIQGVQVHVDTHDAKTPESVVKLAEGPTPDVFPMLGGPRIPTEHEKQE